MLAKRDLLVNEDGRQWWLEQKDNGTLWESEEKIFASEAEANEKGWKIDAVKLVLESKKRRNL